MKLNTNILLVVLVGAMVLVAGLQTVQIATATSAISNAGINVGTASAPSASVAAKAPASGHSGSSSSLQDLQGMVGGC